MWAMLRGYCQQGQQWRIYFLPALVLSAGSIAKCTTLEQKLRTRSSSRVCPKQTKDIADIFGLSDAPTSWQDFIA
jgi:hypothetical protein